jgi:GH25 family lysozyme M1 (1,4-beta-N-acetylmuramidase)
MELDSHKKMTGQELRNLIDAFAKPLEEAGYYIGVYGNENFSNYLSEKDPTIFDEYDFWIANYGSNRSEQYDQVEPRDISQIGSGLGSAGMAQVTDRARISGIDGSVDVNFSYKNYPKIMKDAMKNNH